MADEVHSIVPKPTQVSPALYALVRQIIQAQQNLAGYKVLTLDIEVTTDNIFILRKEIIERTPLA